GIDNENIAPPESVQEEIYFNTPHFFDVVGREAGGPSLDYIGRVLPVVRPTADGKPGHARITFTGFATDSPAVVVNYREGGGAADPATQTVCTLDPNGTAAAFPDPATLRPAGYKYQGGPLVQWDTPIPPPEGHEILARMGTFKEATVYKVGESYLGKDIWAMDLMPPIEASHWSQAKATTLKPTIVYSARQDANEVSSTSHTLKLAEMLLTDPALKDALKKVNVVFHPYTNPDGAELAYDLYKVTPDYLLHPSYLGSL